MFAYPSVPSKDGRSPIRLMGVMHGHFQVKDSKAADRIEFDDAVGESSSEFKEAVNMGIAIVAPAEKILEVLQHPRLLKEEHAAIDRDNAANLPVEDIVAEAPATRSASKQNPA